jgi:hypothetical protein
VEKAISLVNGKFYYRKDIGTKDLVDSKTDHLNRLRGIWLFRITTNQEGILWCMKN